MRPEASAQRLEAPVNPLLRVLVADLRVQLRLPAKRGADHGCGKLRHLKIIRRTVRELWLVDTERQLASSVVSRGRRISLAEYAHSTMKRQPHHLTSSDAFSESALRLDVVFNLCVLDVVPAAERREIVKAASRNLRRGGFLVLVVPRNDQSITVRCTPERRWSDGFAFDHSGVRTFYRNFSETTELIQLLGRHGLRVVVDRSVHRHVALLLRKE